MFKSNAVRSLVELHEIELNRFYDTWHVFRASGVALPRSEDPNYASVDHVFGHVLRAARNYLTWIGTCVQRPVSGVDMEEDVLRVAGRGRAFMDEVLAAWRQNLSALDDEELWKEAHRSRWGEDFNIGQMLEHAVVHPMRHRIQLERLMREAGLPPGEVAHASRS
jgi:uncharacterized damage-inducible protein DinB